MKTLEQLINRQDPGWPIVQGWISDGTNHIEVLPPIDEITRENALVETQVTTRSPMGAIVYETGGILVDHGWVRILGSGHPRLPRSLPDWNRGRTSLFSPDLPHCLLIADDVAGGFFAIDGGDLGHERGKVCYFAPDTLKWENTKKGYSEFLIFCFSGNLVQYYENLRWPGWEKEISNLSGEQVMGIYPWVFTAGPPLSERQRKPISISEPYRLFVDEHAPL